MSGKRNRRRPRKSALYLTAIISMGIYAVIPATAVERAIIAVRTAPTNVN